jgi:hypothetical protein
MYFVAYCEYGDAPTSLDGPWALMWPRLHRYFHMDMIPHIHICEQCSSATTDAEVGSSANLSWVTGETPELLHKDIDQRSDRHLIMSRMAGTPPDPDRWHGPHPYSRDVQYFYLP